MLEIVEAGIEIREVRLKDAKNSQEAITKTIEDRIAANRVEGKDSSELTIALNKSEQAAIKLDAELLSIKQKLDGLKADRGAGQLQASTQAELEAAVARARAILQAEADAQFAQNAPILDTLFFGNTDNLSSAGAQEAIANWVKQRREEFSQIVNAESEPVRPERLFNIDLTGGVFDTFSDLGSSLGEALASGTDVVEALGQSLIGSFGRFLSQLGDQLIAYGLAAQAFDFLTKSFGTPLTGAAAAGAIAAGVALKAAGAAIAQTAQAGFGGGALQGRGVGGGVGGGSLPAGNTGGPFNGAQTVIFEIEGTKLVGVLERTLDRSRRLNSTTIF